MKTTSGRSDIKGYRYIIKFIVFCSLIGLGTYLILSDNSLLMVIGFIINALMFVHGVELEHQAIHYTAVKNKRLNKFLGVVVGLPMLTSFTGYRYAHLMHHRTVGTPEDKEFFSYGKSGETQIKYLFRMLFIPEHYIMTIKRIVQSFSFSSMIVDNKQYNREMKSEYRLFTLIILGAIWLAFNGFAVQIFMIWLGPLLLLSGPIHALIELPEHYGCDRLNKDIMRNTRTIRSNRVMQWFTNCNNYHVEHHLYAGVPTYDLKKVHYKLAGKQLYIERGYKQFYIQIFANYLLQSVEESRI